MCSDYVYKQAHQYIAQKPPNLTLVGQCFIA